MERYYFNIIAKISLGIAFLTSGCNAIFEKDITGEEVTMIIPTNNDTIEVNNVHFKWYEVPGASFYNLQIVQPSFDNIEAFVLDSNITGEEYHYVLSPGKYQFQIRGENSGYQTDYAGPFSIYIDSVSDLSAQTIPLLGPDNDLYSNLETFTFSWQAIYAAENYEFQIRSGSNFNASGTILYNAVNILATSHAPSSGTFASEDVYSWGVKGVNSTSSTAFSSRRLYIDRTPPLEPVLNTPTNGASLIDTVVFKWTNATDIGSVQSPVNPYIQIGNDSLFSSIVTEFAPVADTAFFVFNVSGEYWWRMYALDEAGNISDYYTVQRKIIIP